MYFRADLHFLCEPSVSVYAASKKMWSSRKWWAQVDSNHRPHAYQACALTTWAMSPCCYLGVSLRLVPSSSRKWWRWTGSNRWPPACKAGALPAELHPHAGPLHLRSFVFLFFQTSQRTLKIKQRYPKLWSKSFDSLTLDLRTLRSLSP